MIPKATRIETQPMRKAAEGEQQHRDFYMRRAQNETWRRLVVQGVVTIKGVKP